MGDMVSIAGMDKAVVLAALDNGTRAIGMGRLHDIGGNMSVDKARQIIGDNTRLYFDYVCGRPLKVDISGDSFDPRLYDRDAGSGVAALVIERARKDATAL